MLSADAVQKAKSGHPGAPMGLAPAAYVLWDRFLSHNPRNPAWPGRDRFVLSAGHASMLLYSLLHLTGYDLSMDEVRNFRQWGSRTPGHPEHGLTPGVEATTGPLGQGFANAVGMAIAERVLANTYNRPGHEVINHRTYAVVSDGDLMEGVASEAASLAGTLALGKVVFIYDDNKISIDGSTDLAFRESVTDRFRAYGWHVAGPVDGNDLDGIERAIQEGVAETTRPSLIVVRTVIGFGAPKKAGTAGAHGAPLGDDEIAGARRNLNWDLPPFEVPDEVLGHMRDAAARGEEAERAWRSRFDAYARAYPDLAAALDRDLRGELAPGWQAALDVLRGTFAAPVATRAVSGKALASLAAKLPNLVGGSADLAESTNTHVPGRSHFTPEHPEGRNLNFGVREHAMGAVCNGIVLHGGLVPYGGTFLVFSDYMRAAVRVGALSGLGSIWVFTHDSIGLGEDGPTHQPISQLMGLRLIPGLCVLRPADAEETIEAWRIAVSRRKGPTALVLTRQAVPPLASSGATAPAAGNVERGAYVVRDTPGAPQAILIGTGSEVQLALGAAAALEKEGVRVRVVSMPSWDLFDAQPEAYRDSVLPRTARARVSVEAGTPVGWERYVGLDGQAIGLTRYGASAPGAVVLARLGFTVENVVAAARRVMAGR
jgi:transketolase